MIRINTRNNSNEDEVIQILLVAQNWIYNLFYKNLFVIIIFSSVLIWIFLGLDRPIYKGKFFKVKLMYFLIFEIVDHVTDYLVTFQKEHELGASLLLGFSFLFPIYYYTL